MFNVIKAMYMSNESKIKSLARHLEVKDELLIVNIGSSSDFLVFNPETGDVKPESIPSEGQAQWFKSLEKPFTLIRQRGDDGRFVIPDINEWIRDEKLDY